MDKFQRPNLDNRRDNNVLMHVLRNFITMLAVSRRVSASTQNQAASALCFLYDVVLRRPLERDPKHEVIRAKPKLEEAISPIKAALPIGSRYYKSTLLVGRNANQAARQVVLDQRGATDRSMAMIEPYL